MGLFANLRNRSDFSKWKKLTNYSINLMGNELKLFKYLEIKFIKFSHNILQLKIDKHDFVEGRSNVTSQDIIKIKAEAQEIFNEIKKIELINKLESKRIIELLKSGKKENFGLWQELEKDSALQKEINQETLTLEHLFKKALEAIDVLADINKTLEKGYTATSLYGIIPVAQKVMDEERQRIEAEQTRLVAERKMLLEKLDKQRK